MKRFTMLGVGKGYTIVEALIFLAVSGALLVSAMTLINGRQEKTRFAQGIDDIANNVQDYFNDVSTGYYPSNNMVNCIASGTNNITLSASVSSSPLGTNQDCVFSGKYIIFPYDQADYTAYTIVSRRDANSITDKQNKLLGYTVGFADQKVNNIDLKVTKIIEKSSAGTIVGGVEYHGLIVASDFGSGSGSSLSGNAAKLRLYLHSNQTVTDEVLNTSSGTMEAVAADSEVLICVEQTGIPSKVGVVKITPQLSVERVIGEDDICS